MSINKDKIDHLTHFKNIDNESDDYQRPGTIKERATSQIKKLNFLQTDQSKNVIKTIDATSSYITVTQPDQRRSFYNQKNSKPTLTNMANNSNEDISSKNSNDPSFKQLPLNTIKQGNYNISNVLKHMYTLKQRQTSNTNNNHNASSNPKNTNNNQATPQPNQSSSFQIVTSKQFWMPDDQVKECFECNDKFTMFNRRHHCRVCGQIFCGKCSDYEIPSQLIFPNTTGNIRACTLCHSFVGQMETGDIKTNTQSIKALMQRLSISSSFYSPFSQATPTVMDDSQSQSTIDQVATLSSVASMPNMGTSSTSSINSLMTNSLNLGNSNETNNDVTNNPFDITDHRDCDKSADLETSQLNIITSSSELRNLWVQIYHTSDGLIFQTRNINKFKKINNCITGSELVEWLMRAKSVTKDQAIVIGQALLHGKWLECAYRGNISTANSLATASINQKDQNQSIFYDNNSFYKPGSAAMSCQNTKIEEKSKQVHDTEEGPEWIKELNKLITAVEDETVSGTVDDLPSHDNKIEELFKITSEPIDGIEPLPGDKSSPTQSPIVPLIKIEKTAKLLDDIETDDKQIDTPALNPSSRSNSPIQNSILTPQISPSAALQISNTEQILQPPFTKDSLTIKRSYATICESLQTQHKQHQVDLLKQLLKLKNLSPEWFDIIMPLAWQCVDLVRPDVKHDSDLMDIRNYIKIKKLPGYDKEKSRIVNGLVFTKNLAHKKMNADMKNPKVLLLRSSIEYQRSEEKMSSLEPIFTAESQYLKNYCSKLLLRQNPEILIVEKSVARIAQDTFLQSNVSLVLNVKANIMDKLCRFLQADPMFSIDDVLRKPKLGVCSHFHIDNVKLTNGRIKPLMFFEGTPTNLGCTILLYGGSLNELKVVKSITRFIIYVVYNSKLEQSFMYDKNADFFVKPSQVELKNIPSIVKKELETEHIPVAVQQPQVEDVKTSTANQLEQISVDQGPLEECKGSEYEPRDLERHSDLKLEICSTSVNSNMNNVRSNFKQLIQDVILSCSPFIEFDLPTLMSEDKEDLLRIFLPEGYMDYLKSNMIDEDSTSASNKTSGGGYSENEKTLASVNEVGNENLHEFLLMHLTKSFDDQSFKRNYADYKSRGGIASMTTTKRLILSHIEKIPKQDLTTDTLIYPNQLLSNPVTTKKPSKLNNAQFDCLDILNRQHMAVLFYSQCESSPLFPNICNKPRVIDMKFYSENDMTLGSFLARNCFRTGYKCNNELCNTLIVFHTRTFAHGDSKITIRMSIVPAAPTTNPPQQQTPVTQLQASATEASGLNKSNSNFSRVTISSDEKHTNFSNLNVNALIDNSSSESLAVGSDNSTHNSPMVAAAKTTFDTPVDTNAQKQIIYDDINIFMWSVCKICNKSTKKVTMSPDTWSFSMAKFLELTFHAINYQQFDESAVCPSCPHSLFQDQYQYFRFRNVVTVFSTSRINLRRACLPATVLTSRYVSRSRNEYIDEIKELFEKGLSFQSTLLERINNLKSLNLMQHQLTKLDQYIGKLNSDTSLKNRIEKINLLLTNQEVDESFESNSEDAVSSSVQVLISEEGKQNVNKLLDTSSSNGGAVNYELVEMHLIELRKFITTSIVHWNTKMSEFFKKTKFDEEETPVGVNVQSTSTARKDEDKTTGHIKPAKYSKQASNMSVTSLDNNDLTSSLISGQQSNELSTHKSHNDSSFTAYSSVSPTVNADEASEQYKHSSAISIGKRFIANLMPSSAFQPLKVPFPEEEHYLLSSESKYYINDKNLSSIIAFTLSSKEYYEFEMLSNKLINSNFRESNGQGSSNGTGTGFSGVNSNALQQALQHNNYEIENEATGSAGIMNENMFHFEHQFQDSTTKFYCKVYYADLFSKLRQLIMPNEEEKYVHSLFRCMNWEAKGGKSNSQFRKTLDNRFVLKEMSKQETQSFVEFAPQYVQYVTDSIQNKKATALAKILGAYKICLMKNTSIGSKAIKMDVVVLENLFYDKNLTQVFDLKGSERNRMINVDQQQNKQLEKDIVLLDENFLRWSFDNPIYVKPHTKHVIMEAIENDAKFLSSMFVMDYSLLCGFDETSNMIVVGIIDYLRVFTWDKKVETYLKTISGQGKMPTIVSPEVYKARFVNAIDRYLLAVPDQWYQSKK